MPSEDDTAYKQLFAHPEMVRDLLVGFVPPPVFPVVLYNGKRPWSACTSLTDLIVPLPQELQPLQAAQRYVLVDQRRLNTEALARLDNCAAIAFRVERLETEQDVFDELEKWQIMDSPACGPTVQLGITRWAANRLRRMKRRRMINLTGISKEVEAMNVSFLESLKDALRYEERLDCHRERLRKLLVKRFGPLSSRLNKRIENAEMEDLDRWFDRLFDAKTVGEIFVEKRSA